MAGKLNFVIVGCGRIATLHALGYQDHPDAELHGVCDKNGQRAAEFAREHGVARVYKSYDEVLSDPDVDAVELLVPHHLHCEMAVAACEAQKHISVQKPMALNIAECDIMIEAARRNGVKLKVFENFIFYPPYQLAKKMLDAEEIGEPLSIRYKMNNGGLCSANRPGVEDRTKQAIKMTGEPLRETGWRVDAASWLWRLNDTLAGGGPLVFDDGYHKFSIIMHMMGDVEKVCAWIDSSPVMPGVYQDCPAMIMWKHTGGQKYGIMDIVDSPELYVQSQYYTCDERMEITGTRGVLWVTRCTAAMLPGVAPVVMYRDGKLREYRDMETDWGASFRNSTLDFIDALKTGREPMLSGERGREVLKFALAAIDSSHRKQEVWLNSYEDKKLRKKRWLLGMFGKRG